MRLRFDNYVLDVVRRELWRGSDPVAIEPQVFDLLAYLAQNPDRVVSRDELLQRYGTAASSRTQRSPTASMRRAARSATQAKRNG
jgi:DNA-binding winged helix-turn-helix (wHTH) protein